MSGSKYLLICLIVGLGCGCSHNRPSLEPQVDVAPGLSASVTNSVLHLELWRPADVQRTNASEMISSNKGLQQPTSSSGDDQGHSNEERLMAITADGFLVRFTIRNKDLSQTNTVLFRYGETNDTNIADWKIVGHFK